MQPSRKFSRGLLAVIAIVGSWSHAASAQNTFPGAGNVGIGTLAPNHELIVQGDDPAVQIRDNVGDNSLNAARLELLERAGGEFNGGAFFLWNGDTNRLLIGTKNGAINTNVLVIDRNTNSVGIGTQTTAGYKLSVNGPIRSKEVVVEAGWADFVFDDGYPLMPLNEVESFIDQHGHLPDIPSASEVAQFGVPVGEMQSRLLQKVEELTLHLIDMRKQIIGLQAQNQQLRQVVVDGAASATP